MDRIKTPYQSPPQLLSSGFVVLPGGQDQRGLPILCFPPKSLIHMQIGNVTSDDLVQLIQYYIAITKPEQRMNGFAFLADFRACSASIFRVIVTSLENLQRINKGLVAVFYILVPRSKDLVKSLQKLLGLYQKKSFFGGKKPATMDASNRSFHSVLLTAPQELYQYVSREHLMADFGGHLSYRHDAWMELRQSFDDMLADVITIGQNVPQAQEKLDMLKDFEYPDDEDECQEMVRWMQNKFQEVIDELGLEVIQSSLQELRDNCQHPERHPVFLALVKNPLLKPYVEKLDNLDKKLAEIRQVLRKKWKDAENRLIFTGQLHIFQQQAEPLLTWFDDALKQLKVVDTNSVNSLEHCERVRDKFMDNIYSPGQSKSLEGRELIKKIKKMSFSVSDYSDPIQQQPGIFANELDSKLTSYSNKSKLIHDDIEKLFHFFQSNAKLTKWYRRCIHRLPFHLIPHKSSTPADNELALNQQWLNQVKPFVLKHPAPKSAHLEDLKNSMESVVDNAQVRGDALVLINKIEILTKLLEQRCIIAKDYRDIIHWKKHDDPQTDLDNSVVDGGSFEIENNVDVDFEDELKDLEESISDDNKSHTFYPNSKPEDVDRKSEVSAGQRRYRKKNEPAVVASTSAPVFEYKPTSNLGLKYPGDRNDDIEEEYEQMMLQQALRNHSFPYQKPRHQRDVSVESQPKEETVRKFLENMVEVQSNPFPTSLPTSEHVTPPLRKSDQQEKASSIEYPFANSAKYAPSVKTVSSRAKSLSDLVSELKDIGDVLFKGKQHKQRPISSYNNQKLPNTSIDRTKSMDNLMIGPTGETLSLVPSTKYLQVAPQSKSPQFYIDPNEVSPQLTVLSEPNLSPIIYMERKLQQFRELKDYQKLNERELIRRQALLREADREVSGDGDLSDSGLSDTNPALTVTAPPDRNVFVFKSEAARGRVKPDRNSSAVDSGRPNSDTGDELEHILTELRDLANESYPLTMSHGSTLPNHRVSPTPRSLQPYLPNGRSSESHFPTNQNTAKNLQPSRYSDNFFFGSTSSEPARNLMYIDDFDENTTDYTGKTSQSLLKVKRYNRDLPSSLQPSSIHQDASTKPFLY